MTEADLLGAAHDVLSRQDAIFQFWISGTFAVLITFFFIGNRATLTLKLIVATVYSCFTGLLVFRAISIYPIYLGLRDRLIEMGSTGVLSDSAVTVTTRMNMLVYIAVTLLTLYFIFRKSDILGDNDT